MTTSPATIATTATTARTVFPADHSAVARRRAADAGPIRLFRHPVSGHAHRAELMLSLLGLPFEQIDVDLTGGENRQPAHLARNVFGQVPVIEDGDTTISDSNAILVYLTRTYAPGSPWLPTDPRTEAEIQRWFSVAAGQLHQGPAAARLDGLYQRPEDPQRHQIAKGLFEVMESVLASRSYLAADHPTLADVSIYTYTVLAPEGGVSLAPYPAIAAWLARIEALPGFVAMRRAS